MKGADLGRWEEVFLFFLCWWVGGCRLWRWVWLIRAVVIVVYDLQLQSESNHYQRNVARSLALAYKTKSSFLFPRCFLGFGVVYGVQYGVL